MLHIQPLPFLKPPLHIGEEEPKDLITGSNKSKKNTTKTKTLVNPKIPSRVKFKNPQSSIKNGDFTSKKSVRFSLQRFHSHLILEVVEDLGVPIRMMTLSTTSDTQLTDIKVILSVFAQPLNHHEYSNGLFRPSSVSLEKKKLLGVMKRLITGI